jgi:hypothetical protein
MISDFGRLEAMRSSAGPAGSMTAPDSDNQHHQEPDHKAGHACYAVTFKQRDNNERGNDRRAAPKHVADTVGAQSQLG